MHHFSEHFSEEVYLLLVVATPRESTSTFYFPPLPSDRKLSFATPPPALPFIKSLAPADETTNSDASFTQSNARDGGHIFLSRSVPIWDSILCNKRNVYAHTGVVGRVVI